MKTLYMTIGISGSGKSTYLKKHFKPEIVINPDAIRRELTGNVSNHTMEPVVWATATKRIIDSLNKNGEAVLDAIGVDAGKRKAFITAIKMVVKDSLRTVAIVFPADPEISKQRIKKDLDGGIDRSAVPPEAVDKQYQKYVRGYSAIKQQFDDVQIVTEAYISLKGLLSEGIKRKYSRTSV
jgi:predicted kinase